jgi:tRNA nucleotidyltransferase (CCA-adding enzyme)
MKNEIPDIVRSVARTVAQKGGRAILVGGAVRDMIRNETPKDFDVEVYGLKDLDTLQKLLLDFGDVHAVGKSFGVLKLKTPEGEFDFSFPRTETKTGKGHRGFSVRCDGNLDFATAAKRRDFTINALGYDPLTGEILDAYGGLDDLRNGIIRHIDDASFIEDPLRVYRAVQFAARFGYDIAVDTQRLCRRMVEEGMLSELPKERIYEEWKKLLLKAPAPSVGFEYMRKWGVIKRHFPELNAIIGIEQDPRYHPEGDVWTHTLMSVDAMVNVLRRYDVTEEKRRLKLFYAVLCHDLGKATTTTVEKTQEGVRIRAIGHEKAGIEPTRTLMYRLTNEHAFIESILPLVEHHLKPSQFFKQGAKAGAVRRLATRVDIEELVIVAEADFLGRTTPEAKQGVYEAGRWLLARAEALGVLHAPPEPFVKGRDLIAAGLKPSATFKKILEELYRLQLEGVFENRQEALEYLKSRYV